MTDEFKAVDEMFEAMRERGRTAEPLPPVPFDRVEAIMSRVRRRRRTLAAATGLLAAGLAVVSVVLLWPEREGDEPQPAAVGRAREHPPAPLPAPSVPSRLTRVAPFDDVVAFLDVETAVTFESAERIVLDGGTLMLQLRPTAGARRLVVETPTAKVIVQGTVIGVSVAEGGTAVEVLRGAVEIVSGERSVAVGAGQRLGPGAAVPEPLPDERAVRLGALFPDERPCPPLAVAERPAPADVPAPAVVSRTESSDRPLPGTPEEAGDVAAPPRPDADLDDLTREAELAMRERRFADARQVLEQILSRVPAGGGREQTALYDLAVVCEQLGDDDCVRESLERHLLRHPVGPLREDVRIRLCRFLERTGSPAELTTCLLDYLSEFPEGRKAQWAREALDGKPAGPREGDGV